MTVREALAVLRRRLALIVVAVVVAMVAALAYLSVQHTDYLSVGRVQLPVLTQAATASSSAITVDTDTERVTSTAVLEAAARARKQATGPIDPASITATLDPVRQVMSIQVIGRSAALAQDSARAVTDAYLADQRSRYTGSLNTLKTQRDTLQSQVTGLQAKVIANPKDQLSQAELTAILGTYSSIAQQVTTASLTGSGVTLLQSAQPGIAQSSQSLKVLVLAGVIGLLVGAGAALAREPFDTRIRAVDTAEQFSHAPVLSELPMVRAFRRDGKPLPVSDEPRSPFAAGIRELRTSVQVLLGDVQTPILLVTSPSPMDGKTVVAANLAASYALSGKRTILVSGDLRRMGMDKYFAPDEIGEHSLAGLLEGTREQWNVGPGGPQPRPSGPTGATVVAPFAQRLTDALRRTEIPQLWFLPAGAVQRDPADLLAGPATRPLLAEIRALADIIVIDTPPVLAAADTAILASMADGVLLVTRVAKTDATVLSDAARRLEGSRAPLLGVVLNRSRAATATRYRDYYVEPVTDPHSIVTAPDDVSDLFGAHETLTSAEQVASKRPTGLLRLFRSVVALNC